MKCKFLKINALSPLEEEQLFNQFCLQHRCVTIEKHFVANGDASFWSICVSYLDGIEWAISKLFNAVQWPDFNAR